ncbi:MAG: hypothetical protein ACFE9Q_09135 [Candidatus Hodarchaeota archaeon]
MIVNKDINSHGVFPPEGCPDLDLDKMRKELEQRTIIIKQKKV